MSDSAGDRPAGGPPEPAGLVEGLYQSQRRSLYAFLWARTRSREDALDLLQEVFLRAWRRADALAAMPVERRPFWLFACARRLCIDRHRRDLAGNRAAGTLRDGAMAAAAPPEALVEAGETWRAVDRAARALPTPLREALALTVLGELSSADAGAVLGIPAGTVRYRVSRARQALRDALARAGYTGGEGEDA